ncbi:phosphatidylglycerophosphatase [Roseinatronobacter monicus]|uniref:Phosphatidylglycerophosphatase A n=2 Tax=Roseinatronobacter monicus TaxID=393481 RepID=A0A543KEN1_9RHOB|nr:phosphatidylglycerophosphatase [Roseinatronobacter monicus]
MQKNMTGTRLVATFFGAGLLRPGPGTWGSVAALPVAWLLHVMGGFWALALGTAVVFLVGWWVTIQETRGQSDPDPSEIVIDEVAGMWLALWPVSLGAMIQGVSITALWPGWIVAFLAFRAFDIWKPGPVGLADRMHTPLGVMLDDIIAGALAAMVVAVFAVIAHGMMGI